MMDQGRKGGHRFALLAGVLLLALPGGDTPGQEAPPGGTLHIEVEVVNLYCTVKNDKGGLVADLEARDFEVWEDGGRQKLRYFKRETDQPLTLALLVDTSLSQSTVLPVEQQTVAQFLKQVLRPTDLAALITFDVNVDLLEDFTSESGRLARALGRARINSSVNLGPLPNNSPRGTQLFDAIYLAARVKLGPEAGRKAILVISDGVDIGSKKKIKEALEAAQRSDTIIYAIVVGNAESYGVPQHLQQNRLEEGRKNLDLLANETGGRAVTARSPDKLKEAFDQIAAELRSQYYLAYTPTNRARDGRFRKIEVRVKREGLRVQARRGYYAPTS